MALIRVTRTVLIEEVVVYDSNIGLPLGENVMEDGEQFEGAALLIEKEIDSYNAEETAIFITSLTRRENISKPQIIKIEKV